MEGKKRRCFRKRNRKKKMEKRIRMGRKPERQTCRSKFKTMNFKEISIFCKSKLVNKERREMTNEL